MNLGLMFYILHEDAHGDALWTSGWLPNQMADEGVLQMMDVYFRDAAEPTTFELTLLREVPTKTDTVLSLAEVYSTGYARKTVERDNIGWPELEVSAGDPRVSAKQIIFENQTESDWQGAVAVGLISRLYENDKFVGWRPFAGERLLSPGEKIYITLRLKSTGGA